jgi:hypothetical protein
MSDYIIREHNAETDEVIDRPMTAGEIKELEKTQSEIQAKIALEGQQKSALLEKLGITEEEARLLLS